MPISLMCQAVGWMVAPAEDAALAKTLGTSSPQGLKCTRSRGCHHPVATLRPQAICANSQMYRGPWGPTAGAPTDTPQKERGPQLPSTCSRGPKGEERENEHQEQLWHGGRAPTLPSTISRPMASTLALLIPRRTPFLEEVRNSRVMFKSNRTL